jgi:hypothetical protein
MRFGKSGTQGTNTTLVLELLDNQNAITVPPPTNELGEALRYTVKASIFDINGEPISPTTGDWKWEWKIPMNKNKDDEELLILE